MDHHDIISVNTKDGEETEMSSSDTASRDTENLNAVITDTGSQLPAEELERLAEDIILQLKSVYDPEIPVDIYELGLIYKVDVSDDRDVLIDMTLTAPGCPVAGEMPIWVQQAVEQVQGIRSVKVNMVFDPPWTIDRMSDEARLELNMF